MKSRRKPSGGINHALKSRGKRKYERTRPFVPTVLGEGLKTKVIRVRGGNVKVRVRTVNFANVATPEGVKKVRILNIIDNRANRHFVRSNIITKGAIIETEIGKAIVTSRPNQHGVVNAKLIE